MRNDELLFGECQSVIIVTINEENLFTLVEKAQALNVLYSNNWKSDQ